ncbi:PAS domain-containing protein [Rhodobacter maris]|uniref:PAS domain S-box-containing protein/diguanylate cyclase (GGDEF)-like protein n=1 Tax=Rhodobacter maris TaxID=446682 RepID=A0A285SZU1_9RHOB|nr:PAS domain-containing protein [Rhodobacter maris]SOC14415.1 PAS domain S-box-containing protein/diguanylate cyclase (GGDEF)-like protein [Rhodobacter maris]
MPGGFADFEAILTGFPGAIALVEASGRLCWANPAFTRRFAAEIDPVGRTLADLLPETLLRRLIPTLAMTPGGPARFRVSCEDGGSGTCPLDVSVWSLPAPPEPDSGAVLYAVQLTEALSSEAAAGRLGLALARAEAELEAARAEVDILRISSEASGVVAWHRFPEFGYGEIGAHFGTMLGYPAEERIDITKLAELTHPDDYEITKSDFLAMVDGESQSFCHDFRVRRANGSWAWITSRGQRIDRSDQGLPVMMCGALTDISDRKDSEAWVLEAFAEAQEARDAAAGSAEMMRTAILCGEIAVWTLCPDLGESWLPDEGYQLLGYKPGAFIPDHAGWQSLFHPEDRDESIAQMRALVSGESTVYAVEHRLRHGDGSYHWYRIVARKIDRSARGLPYLISGATTCIDRVKENERRLSEALADAQQSRALAEERSELLRTSAICAGIGHFSICPETGEGWTADETYQLFGFAPGTFPSTEAGWRALIHPDDLPEAIKQAEAMKAGCSDLYSHDHRRRHADGSWHWYRAVARKIDRTDQGLPYLLSGAIINIDAVKENERRLADAATQAEEARARLDNLADNAPGALFEYRRDASGAAALPYFSAKLPLMLGVNARDLIADASTIYTHMTEEHRAQIREMMEVSQQRNSSAMARFAIDHPQHGRRWLAVLAQPYSQSDAATIWFGNLLDVTEQVAIEERARSAAEELRRVHDRMMTMAEHAPGAIFELRRLPTGALTFAFFSRVLPELLGVNPTDLKADMNVLFTHFPIEDLERAQEAIDQSARTMTRFELEHRIDHPERGLRWIHVSAQPFARPDGTIVWYGNTMDVTERVETEKRAGEAADAVRHALERLAWIASIAPAGLYEFKRAADGSTSIPYASPYFEELMGLGYGFFQQNRSAEEVFANVHPDDLDDFIGAQGLTATKMEFWNQRFRVEHPSRGEIWLANSATPRRLEDGAVVWTGALHDVTQDVRREAELRSAHLLAEDMRAENERQALHDGLTSLPNRRYYDKVLAQRIAGAQDGSKRDCTLIRIDLDHFKYVNDTLGHEAGDMVLVRVAQALRETLRASDFAARIGGDEFSIVLRSGSSREEARAIVERLQAKLGEPLLFEGRQCRFGASFGIAQTEDLAQMGSEIQLFADAALYRAKNAGRNRMEFFTPELHTNLLLDRRLAAELQEGLDRDEFVPFFQAQVSAENGALTGVETLLRWHHPERGLLAPDAFMHVAEQLRLVPEIDRVMMEKSRGALARWRARGLQVPKISFNVSAGRMNDPDVVQSARSMVDGETRVTFELLESIFVEEESETFRFHLDAIREAGIEIEIDDFGSGHASIIGLMQIAPSALKIDRRIIAPVARDSRAANLVRAIIEIAETLGIGTVAEGVETEAQASVLRELGCDILQGYLFSMPLSADDFARRQGVTWLPGPEGLPQARRSS